MRLGTLKVVLQIPQARSLKAKRQIVKSIKDRLKNKFNVSVAEVADNDLWQKATLGIAIVSNERRFIDQVLDKIEDQIAARPEIVMLDCEKEHY